MVDGKAFLFMVCINHPLQFLVIINQNYNERTSGMYLKGPYPLYGRHIVLIIDVQLWLEVQGRELPFRS